MDSTEKGIAAVAILGAAAGAGYGIYSITRKKAVPPTPTPSLAKITLSASTDEVKAGDTDTFTATAYNGENEVLSGVSLKLYEITTSAYVGTETTDSNGEASFTVKFNKEGKYTFQVIT